MNRDLVIINGIIFFYILQRLSEVFISNSNEKWLKENCNAVEVYPIESLRMKLFHTLWFVSLVIEANIKKSFQALEISLMIYPVLIACLIVRAHTIEKLKRFWTIKIYSTPKQQIATDGLYQYLRHPNYLVVILELLLIPLLMKAYFTLIFFSIVNLFIQKQRIQLEEETLMKHEKYKQHFLKKYRLLPFVLSLLITFASSDSYGTEIRKQYKDYAEAKASEEFIRFASESKKLGFIKTGFDGFAREFNINYDLVKDKLNSLNVLIAVNGLDTDNGSRNDKMIQEIMEKDKHPQISVSLMSPIVLANGSHETQMAFTIKDKKIIKPVSYTVTSNGEGVIVRGHSAIKLTEAGLPDPSIAIATVRDDFDLTFAVKLK